MPRQHSAKADAKRADTQDLRDRALELRKRGASYPQIARALGVSVGRAHALVQEAIAAIPKENAQAVLAIELEKLDLLEASLMPLATKGDYLAAGAIIKVMDRRARYLGLNAPEKRELTGEGGGPIAVTTPADARRVMNELFNVDAFGKRELASPAGPGSGGSGAASVDPVPAGSPDVAPSREGSAGA